MQLQVGDVTLEKRRKGVSRSRYNTFFRTSQETNNGSSHIETAGGAGATAFGAAKLGAKKFRSGLRRRIGRELSYREPKELGLRRNEDPMRTPMRFKPALPRCDVVANVRSAFGQNINY